MISVIWGCCYHAGAFVFNELFDDIKKGVWRHGLQLWQLLSNFCQTAGWLQHLPLHHHHTLSKESSPGRLGQHQEVALMLTKMTLKAGWVAHGPWIPIYRWQVLFHRGCHVVQACLYSVPEQTNQTLAFAFFERFTATVGYLIAYVFCCGNAGKYTKQVFLSNQISKWFLH